MNTTLKITGVVIFVVIIVGIYFHFDIGGYDVGCLDDSANNYCQEYHFSFGHADRGAFGLLGRYGYKVQPMIICIGSIDCDHLREGYCPIPTKKFNYLESELDYCKKE